MSDRDSLTAPSIKLVLEVPGSLVVPLKLCLRVPATSASPLSSGMLAHINRRLLPERPDKPNSSTLSESSLPGQTTTAVLEPQSHFPFLSQPLEIRLKIYEILLIPNHGLIELLYAWNYANGPRLRFIQQGPYVESPILLADKQIYAEASSVLYRQAVLYLRCDESLRMPFSDCPLKRSFIGDLFKDPSKLFPETLRRFKKIRLAFLVGATHSTELEFRDVRYFGSEYGYTPCEMRGAIKGFKEVLNALAAASEFVDDVEHRDCIKRSNVDSLNLDLEWPS